MKLVPHRHFGMPGSVQKHTLVYTIVIAMMLTVFFDLSRIASLGVILYLTMDVIIQWGVFRHLRETIKLNPAIILTAIVIDVIVLGAFLIMKAQSDMLIIYASIIVIGAIFLSEKVFLSRAKGSS